MPYKVYKVRYNINGHVTTIRFLDKDNALATVKGNPATKYAGEELVNDEGSTNNVKD